MNTRKTHAQSLYNHHFLNLRREAKENNLDLSLLLSQLLPNELMPFNMPSESHRITPPDTSKMKQRDRELCLKEWYRPHFYEHLINDLLWEHVDVHRLVLRGRKRGGNTRGEQKKQKKDDRQEIIIQTARELDVKKLLADGMKKKDINELVADSIPNENVKYVREILAPLKYNP